MFCALSMGLLHETDMYAGPSTKASLFPALVHPDAPTTATFQRSSNQLGPNLDSPPWETAIPTKD
jgi:hypothetical protein